MNHYALFHSALQTNDKYYQFSWQPGTPWTEIYAALDQFKTELAALEEKYKVAAAQAQAKPVTPVEEPVVVQEQGS